MIKRHWFLTRWQESEEVVDEGSPLYVVLGDLGPVPHPEAVLDEHEAVLVPHQVKQVHGITDDVEEEPRGQGLEALLFYFQSRPFHPIFLKYMLDACP